MPRTFGRLAKGKAFKLAEGATIHHHELRWVSFSEQARKNAVRGVANLGDLIQGETVRPVHDSIISAVEKT
jgi:hypothetical protein